MRQRLLLGVLVILAAAPSASCRPPHKQALADYFGPFLAKPLNDCRTCHLPGSNDSFASEKPHNPFGERLKAVRKELAKAGKNTAIADRLDALADEDSDGDGVSNLIELLTGHNPGDANDRPTAAEVTAAQKTLAAFRQMKAAYPWRPFETVQRPAEPKVRNTSWVRNPIDAFIAAEHEAHGLKPRPEASRTTLLRRVTLDLTGLPPTPHDLHAFLGDSSPDAYEKVVDRLLASPLYGERWGRHWMDVWRYSDWAGWTDGKQIRDSQPHIWHWRDWIVESLNADKGYNRMVQEMLAGDELAPEDPDAIRATGYLARNYKMLSRETWMQDVVNHTAQAFLGVTLACARCHDHLYDPITQKEYYQVRAIFEPHEVRIDRLPGERDTTKDGIPRAYDAKSDAKTFLFIRGDDRTPDKTPLSPGLPEALGGRALEQATVALPLTAYSPNKRPFVIDEMRAKASLTLERARQELRTKTKLTVLGLLSLFQGTTLGHPLSKVSNLFVTKVVPHPLYEHERITLEAAIAEAEVTLRAIAAERLEDHGKKGSEEWRNAATAAVRAQRTSAVCEARKTIYWLQNSGQKEAKENNAKKLADARTTLAKAEAAAKLPDDTNYAKLLGPTYSATSTGRRLAFARWLTDRANPLTARVAVNHVWLRHFGQALVPTVADFGRNGRPPSHPALLDWLAAEFMERGWSMKQLHRLIVTSSAYRTDSTPDANNLALDRDNKYLWRVAPRRLEAEAVRDGLFFVAGRLDVTRGGPDIDYAQGLTVPRRSLYFRHAQEKQMEFLKLFDVASVTECYQRKESVLPQQALALANSELTRTNARHLARSLQAADDVAFVTAAFERVLSRSPTEQEQAECVAFLAERAQRNAEGKQAAGRARENLVQVLLNHHDFVTIR